MSVKAHHDLLPPKVGQLHRGAIDGLELKVGCHVTPLEKVFFGGTPSSFPAAALLPAQTRSRTCIVTISLRCDGSAARDAICGFVIVCHNYWN